MNIDFTPDGRLDIDKLTKEFNRINDAAKAAYNPETIKIGDVITFYHRPYLHNATIEITKK